MKLALQLIKLKKKKKEHKTEKRQKVTKKEVKKVYVNKHFMVPDCPLTQPYIYIMNNYTKSF